MTTKELALMMSDKHFLNLKKMQHKYSRDAVAEMVEALSLLSYKEVALRDFSGDGCVYMPSYCAVGSAIMKRLLATHGHTQHMGRKAMETEIDSTLKIENIHTSRESVRKILAGLAPENEQEDRIFAMKRGLEFIADTDNEITEANLHHLYMLGIDSFLDGEDKILEGRYYRHDAVFVVGDKPYHEGISAELLPKYMAELVRFANQKDDIPELIKACIIHFYIAYLHPYFDGNGRMARLLHLWYLVQQGFPSTLFYAFSEHINASKTQYYDSFMQIQSNCKISGRLDFTPFISYFSHHVYTQIENRDNATTSFAAFQNEMANGRITPKERELWSFVLSAYGTGEFSTKQLERDFGDAAYATIRSFVLKFEELGLLVSQRFSSRVRYRVAGD